jgi:glycosyltransferase involved in cell wall biosynthesis
MKNSPPASKRTDALFGIIIPACNEEASLGGVLAELRATLDSIGRFVVAVGVNGTNDQTADIARKAGVVVGETGQRGYGHGCQAAIDALKAHGHAVDALIFYAADGANYPRDIPALIAGYEQGADFVTGSRTRRIANWRAMNLHYIGANLLFGTWVGLLTGRFYSDLGPLRLIESHLFEAMRLQEWTFGWTIEAQVRASQVGASSREVPVTERERIAGEQKVSRVSALHTARIGFAILQAGWRCRFHKTAERPADHRGFGNRYNSPHGPRATIGESKVHSRVESGKAARSRVPQKT